MSGEKKWTDKVMDCLKSLWRRFNLADWAGLILAILKSSKKEDLEVNEKYIVLKPRILSDDNMLRGLAGLQGVLALIPHTAIAAPILGLGAVGFRIWKKISLSRDYDQLKFPPMDPNMLRLAVELDPELNKHYGHLVRQGTWKPENLKEIEPIFNDFQFITSAQMLKSKYPQVSSEYITGVAARNSATIKANISKIEQIILDQSTSPEMDHQIKDTLQLVKTIFPAMNDWALFNSDGFDEVTEILDNIF